MAKKICLALSAAIFFLALVSFVIIFSPRKNSDPHGPGDEYSVLMIVSDALRRDILGCYGGAAATPNLDRLAEEGVLFENAYSTSPWTAPSSVSMFTGSYATTYAFSELMTTVQIHVPQSEYLFVEFLHEQGYVTKMLIENDQASLHGNLQGFELLPGTEANEQAAPEYIRDEIESITGTILTGAESYKNSLIVLNHLFNMPSGSNFFTLHWMEDPHCPYSPTKKFRNRISVDRSSLSHPEKQYSSCIKEAPELTPQEAKFIKDLYTAEVESVDERVGYALKILRHRDRMKNTIVIFTSDHGELFGEHGQFGHGWFGRDCHYYEDLIRVPLIVAGADLPAGKRVGANVSLLDLIPTLADLMGQEYDADWQGRSFKPLLLDETAHSRDIYHDDVREHDQMDALRAGEFKLICSENDHFELYEISKDPGEQNNLAPSRPQLVESIYEKLLKIRAENEIRRAKNVAAFDESTDILDINKRKMIEKLRSLGYIE